MLAGLRSDVTRAQLARAAVEGVVCNLLDGADELVRWTPEAASGRVMLIGGGARSAAYQQVTADLLGRQVLVLDSDELVARGAAIQAAATLAGTSIEELAAAWGPASGTTIDPDPSVDGAAIRAGYADALRADG